MTSINKVIIVGRLGADPENRYMPNGEQVSSVSVATSDRWRDKASGEMRESTEWHRVSFFGKLAEISGQYLKKGSLVYIEGKLRSRKYTDKEGIQRSATDIIADTMQMLGGRPSQDDSMEERETSPLLPSTGSTPRQSSGLSPNFSDTDDDIPF